MSRTVGLEEIRAYITTELLGDETLEIAADQDLLLSEILDSLGVTRLVEHLEIETGIEIPPEDVTLENFQSIDCMLAYLDARRAA